MHGEIYNHNTVKGFYMEFIDETATTFFFSVAYQIVHSMGL